MAQTVETSTPAPFRAAFAPEDEILARVLLAEASLPPAHEPQIDAEATRLIEAIRAGQGGIGGIEQILQEYSLSTKEGLALMVLAEALLRVPDSTTADKLIEDKLGQGNFLEHQPKSDALLINASAWALGIGARIIQPGETPDGILASLAKRIGLPTIRTAARQAMRVMGNHFVLGQTIDEALNRAGSGAARSYRYSFDMLGEGARTAEDAERYFQSYADAIRHIGAKAGNAALPNRPGISVKLSALHPRYEATNQEAVLAELTPRVVTLAEQAKSFDLNFTIDAEEADRLELSLDLFRQLAQDSKLAGWDGLGLAVQAYQKRGRAVIAWLDQLAQATGRRFMVRLVKGAYWDTEVKRAQERGLPDFPVFTRKAMTDLNYAACAKAMLQARPRLYPQFATHNALTIATIRAMAGNAEGYEFQRLHGMGEAAYSALLAQSPDAACRVYAPVGGHRDLLAYLVRRLLENGANSSFVNEAADSNVPVSKLLTRPATLIGAPERARHKRLARPEALFPDGRRNSRGYELGHAETLEKLLQARDFASATAASLISGQGVKHGSREAKSPIDGKLIGSVFNAMPADARAAIEAAREGFHRWGRTEASHRAALLRAAADKLEARTGRLVALLQREAGKTLDDCIAEIREAVDFLRYYADEAERVMGAPIALPGPTGEDNRLLYRPRGVIVAIAPWNFPLAIFLGQVAAALAAGNTVVAKPAEQTPLIGMLAVELLHEAGIPKDALHLVLGDGAIGAALVEHPAIAGVVFTGSTETARRINRALAAKEGPIIPLIAETGGINAMIVDATALPEQVADDVVLSAFRSAGQRCSALRLLCVQEDVADRMIEMIVGAAKELRLGDPTRPETHIGPVIDAEAKDRLDAHIARMKREAKVLHAGEAPQGLYVAPHVFGLQRVEDLGEEIFGPVLHVVRYKAGELMRLVEAIDASGFGLTFGMHSRIDSDIEKVTNRLQTGNIYVNRNMIGAVVGVQPFGGHGLSGTGPKAGGPNYLLRFATEQVISVNSAAAGGNASLMALSEE
ncbi:MAG: bifunctional proline dehydrogenase/L-glutamate gamma-semialdehyde dehydrogenase PutA [Methylobacterium sp.]|nr:bifunctional proline dehydrogenase/L-glutamate gamma-semialdehyde dehydrogenase PutA [Methylobacterium sp.]MCA3656197.1 bifunctional proline dehydrogenase/L-glutamate gamma-semialdehyde dehydrogenase PutA [Methylobacterium sp.]MCA3659303.1 bifunctional proline dehydrogenase/L-glutamate gamma-semialdehyde dehydrogenase PutA [Methylobacterium sp.]MCA3661964.1 bifunctional proline dehydrogenase/L-glutamate gamma-semialdehyde dehydrogenase PutA [Methylobacterium sp.]MCA3662683.1 bifunctional pro